MLTVNDIIQRYEHARGIKSYYTSILDDIFKYYLPRRMGMHDTYDNQGKDRAVKIYDGTPGGSLLRLAAVINSTLSNQSMNWFVQETDDEELNELSEVKEWLSEDTKVVRKELEASNFYQQIHEFYIDICGPAVGCLYVEEAEKQGTLYFSTRHLKEYCTLEDSQGNMNGICVVREMSAWQIADRWRDKKISGNVPKKALLAIEQNKPQQMFNNLHFVIENDEYEEKNEINPNKFLYASVWVDIESKQEIDRGGYHEMPYIVEYWSKASGEYTGRGPAWDALPDTKSLYSMKKSMLRVGEKIADPPIMMPHSTTAYPVSLQPGGLSYFDTTSKHPPFPLNLGQGFPIGKDMIEDQRKQIMDWFYISQLHLIDTKEMTAEEVRARTLENAKILGPTTGRLNNFFEKLFVRNRGILGRKGKLPKVPDIVLKYAEEKGIQLKVKFVSPIVKAAALSEVQGIVHSAGTAIQWAKETQDPSVLDNLNLDFGIRKIAELDGAPPEFLVDEKLRDKRRKARQDMQQKQQEMEMLKLQAGAAKDATAAQGQGLDNQQRMVGNG